MAAEVGARGSNGSRAGVESAHAGRALRYLLAAALLARLPSAGAEPASRTQLVLLGTGTPRPLPDLSGPCTAIVVVERVFVTHLKVVFGRDLEVY